MGTRSALAALILLLFASASVLAETDTQAPASERLDALFAALRDSSAEEALAIQSDIYDIWHDPGSDSMRLIFNRAQAAMSEGRLGVAVDHLDDLVLLAPEFAEGWNARATAHYLAGAYQSSLDDIRETLAREPRHFGALSGKGLVYLSIGNFRLALDAFRQALSVHPHLPAANRMVQALERRFGRTI